MVDFCTLVQSHDFGQTWSFSLDFTFSARKGEKFESKDSVYTRFCFQFSNEFTFWFLDKDHCFGARWVAMMYFEFPLITLPTLFISRWRRRNASAPLCTSVAKSSNVGRGVEIAATTPVRLINLKTATSVNCCYIKDDSNEDNRHNNISLILQ